MPSGNYVTTGRRLGARVGVAHLDLLAEGLVTKDDTGCRQKYSSSGLDAVGQIDVLEPRPNTVWLESASCNQTMTLSLSGLKQNQRASSSRTDVRVQQQLTGLASPRRSGGPDFHNFQRFFGSRIICMYPEEFESR
ncbi:unnamed protein product [Protopolystoma xenopodis]|uniref:Uncharacterized protein n=1 Tax=Protopolystoma xenopodis TaxID=117903 RepID=A0A448X3D7_9PLAT|nr:unnamed protein product [Protopolystoma xenopodis]